MQLRLFNPDHNSQVNLSSTLQEYFDDWYVDEVRSSKRRKPIAKATIDRRGAAVKWWTRLMTSIRHPGGPPLGEITEETLAEFQRKLETAEFKRGKFSFNRYPLSPVSQIRTLEEVQIVLATAGPATGRRVRAGLLAESPAIYVPAPECFPKSCWTLDQAKSIARSVRLVKPPRRKCSESKWWRLLEATLALWFYTGHRATTYQGLTWDCLVEDVAGEWYLKIRSVKTRKLDRIAVHPQLLDKINALRGLDPVRIFPWPVSYGAIDDYHERIQTAAQIPASQQYSPQAWRRLHSREIARVGYALAKSLSSGTLGHSSSAITESHYASSRDAAVLLLPNLFGEAKAEQSVG